MYLTHSDIGICSSINSLLHRLVQHVSYYTHQGSCSISTECCCWSSMAASDLIMSHHYCTTVSIGYMSQNVIRCSTQHFELISGCHLAICWRSHEYVLNSAKVLSPLLDQRHGMQCTTRQHNSGSICGLVQAATQEKLIQISLPLNSILVFTNFIMLYISFTHVRPICFYLRISYGAI